MKEFILITGASSGIGLEMARILATKHFNLILVSRSAHKLEQIQQELQTIHPIEVNILVYDLSVVHSSQDVYDAVKENGWIVSGLINNAGFGDYGNFIELPLNIDQEMIAVNVTSLVGLTKLFGLDMVKAKRGKIMNVASLLSFLPLPYFSVYSATKSFVLAFTESLSVELEPAGVRVTALCPGTVETTFHTPKMRQTNAMKTNKPMSAKVVAAAGVELFLHGKGKKIVGFKNWFISNLPRITPDKIMIKIKTNLARISA
jgi:short-subunit dehydrogenase